MHKVHTQQGFRVALAAISDIASKATADLMSADLFMLHRLR
jgi:hypothetical protein